MQPGSRLERWLIMPPGWVERYEDNVWVVMRRQRRSAEDSGFGKTPAWHVFLFPCEAVCPACGLLNVLDTGPLRVEGKHRDDYREIPTDRPGTRQPRCSDAVNWDEIAPDCGPGLRSHLQKAQRHAKTNVIR